MTNIIKGRSRRNLKKLTNKRAQVLRNNTYLSDRKRKLLEDKIESAEKILELTLDDLANHHYDY